jgi:hypothetical protein
VDVSRIELHIDALVLDGVDPADRAAFAAALQADLARVIGESGVAGAARHDGAAVVAAPPVDTPAATPAALGAATARVIQGGLS